jgi:hypothetical protein
MDEKFSAVARHSWIDSFGATVSIACAIQCSIYPLLIGVLPLVGLGFLLNDHMETIFLVTAIMVGIGSFAQGFRAHHRMYVLLFLAGAMTFIFIGRQSVDQEFELLLVVSGSLVLATGHFVNRRLCRLCAECNSKRAAEID